jgi:hypothetical protein
MQIPPEFPEGGPKSSVICETQLKFYGSQVPLWGIQEAIFLGLLASSLY